MIKESIISIEYNLPKYAREKILLKWKDYRETFGFEADIYKNMTSEGKSSKEIEAKLAERRTFIAELWKK